MSSTALLIAASTSLASREPRLAPLLEEGDAALADAILMEAGTRGRFLLKLLERRSVRRTFFSAEKRFLPGIQLHYRARKRRIATLVERAITGGATQVVIAGAGYDGLGLRIARTHPGTTVFDVDRPGVVQLKRRAFTRLGIVDTNLHHVGADLASISIDDAVRENSAFRMPEQTVVLAEGLLMYFREADVVRFLAGARALARPRGRIIFTVMNSSEDGPRFRRQHPLVAGWLARSAEPFRWGMKPACLTGFLAKLDLFPATIHDHRALVAELDPVGNEKSELAEGEYLVEAHAT